MVMTYTNKVNSIQEESCRCTAQANKGDGYKDHENMEKSIPPYVNITYPILRKLERREKEMMLSVVSGPC